MQPPSSLLDTSDHRRDIIGMTYVYPVVSRRAGGVSIGINLNPNNACNWRCIYCQVPNLQRGAAPKINLTQLEEELRIFLTELIQGDFMQKQVPKTARNIQDIALSGNGEPTSAKEFDQVIALIKAVKKDFDLPKTLKLVLITNGSLINRPYVVEGLKHMAQANGEVWYKFDRATRSGRQQINNTNISLKQTHQNIKLAGSLCPTWLQTCVFQINQQPPSDSEICAYLKFIDRLLQDHVSLQGVLLYGLARPSLQHEAETLSTIDAAWMEAFGKEIETRGLSVKINP